MENQGKSLAFFDQFYSHSSSFLTCFWYHKLKGSLELTRTEVHLQSLKKGSDSINIFLQKIKVARDKLLAARVIVDNEEFICIVLRGLPRDFAHFCSAIWTRSNLITYEQLAIILQSEEQTMIEHLDSIPHSLAMFASNSKSNSNSQNPSQNHGSGRARGINSSNRGRWGGRYNHNGGQQFTSQTSQGFSP